MLEARCKRVDGACHGFWEDQKILQRASEHKRPSIAFSFSNGHFWLFDHEGLQALAQWKTQSERNRPEFLPVDHEVYRDNQQTALQLLRWPDDPFDVPPTGDFFTCHPDVLLHVRLQLLARNRCPRLRWRGLDVPTHLIYQKTREEGGGRLHLRLRCAEHEHLKRATERLTGADSYADEPLGSWMCKTVRCLLKGHRNYISRAQRDAILARQGNKCAKCGVEFSDEVPAEIDHKTPVGCATNHESELWALCPEDHHNKTVADKSKFRLVTESKPSDSGLYALVVTQPQGGHMPASYTILRDHETVP